MQKIKVKIATNSAQLLSGNVDRIASAQTARDSQLVAVGQVIKHEESPFRVPEHAISFRSGFYLNVSGDQPPSSFDPSDPPHLLFRVALPQGKKEEVERAKSPSLMQRVAKIFAAGSDNNASFSFDPNKPEEQLYDVLEVSIPLAVDQNGYLEIKPDAVIDAVRLYDDFSYKFAMNRILEFANPSFPVSQEPQEYFLRIEETSGFQDVFKNIDGGIESAILNQVFRVADSIDLPLIEDHLQRNRICFNSRYDPVKPKDVDLILMAGQSVHTADQVCRQKPASGTQNIFKPLRLVEIYMISAADGDLSNKDRLAALLIEEVKQNLLLRGIEVFDPVVAPHNKFVPTELARMTFNVRTSDGAVKLGLSISELKNVQGSHINITINYQPDPWGGAKLNLPPIQARELQEGYRFKIAKENAADTNLRADLLRNCVESIERIIQIIQSHKNAVTPSLENK
jgi:hypothetical protein